MEKERLFWPVIAICCFVIVIVTWWCIVRDPTTIVVVRHAERADATANSNLSAAGLARAQALVQVVDDVGLDAVYSTEFCRTAQTAQPTAVAEGLVLNIPSSALTGSEISGCSPQVTVASTSLAGSLDASQLSRITSSRSIAVRPS